MQAPRMSTNIKCDTQYDEPRRRDQYYAQRLKVKKTTRTIGTCNKKGQERAHTKTSVKLKIAIHNDSFQITLYIYNYFNLTNKMIAFSLRKSQHFRHDIY